MGKEGLPKRETAMRGDFRYVALSGSPGAWHVYRNLGAVTVYLGNAVRRSAKLWDGNLGGVMTCTSYRSREQVSYCLDRKHRADYHSGW